MVQLMSIGYFEVYRQDDIMEYKKELISKVG